MHNRGLLWCAGGVAVLSALACQRPNPGYHPMGTGGAGGAGGGVVAGTAGATGSAATTGAAGTTGIAGASGTTGIAGAAGTTGIAGAGVGGITGAAGSGGTTGAGGVAGTTGTAGAGGNAGRGGGGAGGSTAGAGGRGGAGGGLANCTDGDGDGYGVGTGCLGADCDDANNLVTANSSRSCYTGSAITKNVGVCRLGTQLCVAGAWLNVCNGEVLPSGEACNGQDDDCNGSADDGFGQISCGTGACARQVPACNAGQLGVCVALPTPTVALDGCDNIDNDCDGVVDEDCGTVACVRVSPTGDDAQGNGNAIPFRSIQSAINYAAMPDRPRRVCVAGGLTCLDKATYVSLDGVGIVMANGVSVYGNYESATWTRCPLSIAQVLTPGPNVTLQTQTATGVEFPATVTSPTTLDGFAFNRLNGDTLPSTAAVTVTGAKQVTLSNLVIADAPNAIASWGINLVSGAQALITRSLVSAGGGTMETVAIRSAASQPTIQDNCSNIDPNTGRCAVSNCTGLGLRARDTSSGRTPDFSTAIELKNSPNAIVQRNAICGGVGNDIAGVRQDGPSAGTVIRGNSILIHGGGQQSHGVRFDGCADATPWVVDNEVIQGDGGENANVTAIQSLGACHPVIQANVRLFGGGAAAAARTAGVACGALGTSASRCLVLGNKLIQAGTSTNPAQSIGVACDAGGCARVAGNTIAASFGADVVGVYLGSTTALVERNNITGGCGTRTTTGIHCENSASRIENNLVRGATCSNNLTTATALGLHVHVANAGPEVDIHSNTIDAGGSGSCNGAAIVFGTSTPGAATAFRRGIFRNNILRAGACSARYGFREDTPPTDPRIFENNDLDPTGVPTALYLDADTIALSTEAQLNALTGTSSSGNISADPMFTAPPSDLRIGAGSRCGDAGTTAGAPATDFAGRARDAKPDIGAHER